MPQKKAPTGVYAHDLRLAGQTLCRWAKRATCPSGLVAEPQMPKCSCPGAFRATRKTHDRKSTGRSQRKHRSKAPMEGKSFVPVLVPSVAEAWFGDVLPTAVVPPAAPSEGGWMWSCVGISRGFSLRDAFCCGRALAPSVLPPAAKSPWKEVYAKAQYGGGVWQLVI